jgi:hypothetical protein
MYPSHDVQALRHVFELLWFVANEDTVAFLQPAGVEMFTR